MESLETTLLVPVETPRTRRTNILVCLPIVVLAPLLKSGYPGIVRVGQVWLMLP